MTDALLDEFEDVRDATPEEMAATYLRDALELLGDTDYCMYCKTNGEGIYQTIELPQGEIEVCSHCGLSAIMNSPVKHIKKVISFLEAYSK